MNLPRTLSAMAAPVAPAAGRPRASVRLRCETALWRQGLWPILAFLLLASAAWIWFVERSTAEQALLVPPPRLAAGVGRKTDAAADEAGDAQRLAIFRNTLQPQADTPALVQRLVELTRQDLAWRQAEFQYSEDKPLNLLRTQITVPVAGTYPRLRQALDLALRELPNLSIDQVLFQRQSSGESTLNARVRLSFWMEMPGTAVRPALQQSAVAASAPAVQAAVADVLPATSAASAPQAQPGAPARAASAMDTMGAGMPAGTLSAAPVHSPKGRR